MRRVVHDDRLRRQAVSWHVLHEMRVQLQAAGQYLGCRPVLGRGLRFNVHG